MIKRFLSLLLIVTVWLSCNTIEPHMNHYPLGSRDYGWKLILLNENTPFNSYTKIWGGMPSDIWIVGSAGDFDKTILRFNGEQVTNYGHLPINPRAVFGVLNNEVWFTGTEFDFWKYDGSIIYKFSEHPLQGYSNSFLGDIWGDRENNIYAVGSVMEDSTGKIKNLIMHYNGSLWVYVIYPVNELQFLSIRKGLKTSKYYLVGYNIENNISNFYEFDGSNIKLISIGETNSSSKAIALLDGITYFNNDKVIYKHIDGNFKLFVSLKNTIADGVKIWGRNENDFFIQTKSGLGHFNGTDLETLYPINGNFGIFEGLIFESEIYFIGYYRDTFRFFLIHGKRK